MIYPFLGGPQVVLEVKWDGTNWTDETAYVRELRYATPRRARLQQVFEPGWLEVTLDNRTRRFEPTYTSGALYGEIEANKEIRFRMSVPSGSLREMWTGWTDGFSFSYPGSNSDATVTISAVDALAKAAVSAIPAGTTPTLILGQTMPFRELALITAAGSTDISITGDTCMARGSNVWNATVEHNLLDELRRCAEFEVAPLLTLEDGSLYQFNRYWFLTRAASASSQATIATSTLPISDVVPVWDAVEMVTAASMADEYGNVVSAVNSAGVTAYGDRYRPRQFAAVPAETLPALQASANAWVGLRGGSEWRLDEVVIKPGSSSSWWAQVVNRQLLDRITVDFLPHSAGSPVSVPAFIDGMETTITRGGEWETRWHLWPASQFDAIDFFIIGSSLIGGTDVIGF